MNFSLDSSSSPLTRRSSGVNTLRPTSAMVSSRSPPISPSDTRPNVVHSMLSPEQDPEIALLLENNRRYVDRMLATDADYFLRRSQSHKPKSLFVGCADARVPADLILGLESGDVFVHRNIANQVAATDVNCGAVIEYAVNSLKVQHIIVCGHYGCGGIKYALESDGWGMIDHWMRSIRDVYRMHVDELDAIEDKEARLRRLVELNVAEQVVNIFKSPSVQHSVKASGFPRIHGMVYDLCSGLLTAIDVSLVKDPLRRYDHVFLFSTPSTQKHPVHSPATSSSCSSDQH